MRRTTLMLAGIAMVWIALATCAKSLEEDDAVLGAPLTGARFASVEDLAKYTENRLGMMLQMAARNGRHASPWDMVEIALASELLNLIEGREYRQSSRYPGESVRKHQDGTIVEYEPAFAVGTAWIQFTLNGSTGPETIRSWNDLAKSM